MKYGHVHLHLGPMRTLSTAEQLNFAKNTLREAFKKLAKTVELNEQATVITATSYVVAAMPDLFRRYGFEITALPSENRNKYWGGEKRPVLKASINREEFLSKYGE